MVGTFSNPDHKPLDSDSLFTEKYGEWNTPTTSQVHFLLAKEFPKYDKVEVVLFPKNFNSILKFSFLKHG